MEAMPSACMATDASETEENFARPHQVEQAGQHAANPA